METFKGRYPTNDQLVTSGQLSLSKYELYDLEDITGDAGNWSLQKRKGHIIIIMSIIHNVKQKYGGAHKEGTSRVQLGRNWQLGGTYTHLK